MQLTGHAISVMIADINRVHAYAAWLEICKINVSLSVYVHHEAVLGLVIDSSPCIPCPQKGKLQSF